MGITSHIEMEGNIIALGVYVEVKIAVMQLEEKWAIGQSRGDKIAAVKI